LGADGDRAVVRFDDAAHNGQAQAGAFALGGVEQRGEGALALLAAHAFAGVLKLNHDSGGLASRAAARQRFGW